jgi:hypothetical protein
MNEQQPYEKHLADKLQKLDPPGDARQHWPQMKALLDRELPEAGGRRGRWWLYGSIILVLMGGAWLGTELRSGNKESISANAATEKDKAGHSSARVGDNRTDAQEPATESGSDNQNKSLHNAGENVNTNKKNQTVNEDINSTPNSASGSIVKDSEEKREANKNISGESITIDKNSTGAKENLKQAAKKELETVFNKNSKYKDATGKSLSTEEAAGPVIQVSANSKVNKGSFDKFSARKSNFTGSDKIRVSNSSGFTGKGKKNNAGAVIEGEKAIGEEDEYEASAKMQLEDMSAKLATGPLAIAKDSIDVHYSDVPAKSLVVARATPSRFKENSERVQRLKNRVVGAGDNKNLVFGLTLPLSMPLSDQRVVGYNINGGGNTTLDYLPSPHVQYHFSQTSFLHAEIQFASPQFIQPTLIAQSRYELSGSGNYKYITNSIFARKLYYFNFPIGIHYSPFRNFYLGSGLQFSSLLSGIAQFEKRGSNVWTPVPSARDTLISQSFGKFKNDSLSSRFNGSEFRLMLDANYYWHRFTVGMRYNQALSNYISVQINNGTPLFTDKNKALQIYLRYNLWEDRKKTKKGLMAKQ